MKKGIVPLDWELIGAMLANGGDDEQVPFFKSFLNEMRSWGTNHQIHFQLASIARQLNSADRELMSIFCNEHGDD